MYEPTYLVPRHLLFSVQAWGDLVNIRRRRLTRAIETGLDPVIVARRRDRLNGAALGYQCAILLAAEAGATSAELVGYGVAAELAAALNGEPRR